MEGISPALKDLIIKGNTGLDSIKELKDFLKQAKVSQIPHQPVHVEIIIKNHGRVIFCKYINDSTFHELASGKLIKFQYLFMNMNMIQLS